MYKTFARLAALAFAFLILPSLRVHAALVQNGASQYVIVLPKDAIPAEETAAAELSDYVQQMTGAKLATVSEENYDGQAKMLAVGFNAKLPAALRASVYGALGDDEVIIASSGETLLIGGGRPRGSLYAAYEFLHRLGVRWYTAEATNVPKLNDITLPKQAYRYNPPMLSRSELIGSKPTQEWSARNRLNQYQLWSGLDEKYGGGYGQGPDMHTFWRLLSLPVLQAHPEWMAELKGQREKPVGSAWGVCLSNVELRKYLVDRTLDWARKNPNKKGVWIGQNDGSPYCTCPNCTAFYKAHGDKPSALTVQLLNELADALKKEMPDRLAKTLAYSWSVTAPTNIRVRDNAMVMFCAGGEFSKPIATDPERQALRQAAAEWRAITKNLEVYLYAAPWENYWFVEPSTYSAAQNIQWAKKAGITSIFTQVSGYGETFGSESVYLRGWVYARMTWDPSQNPQDLIEDFVRGYYGPAADTVLRAIKLVHTDVLDSKGNLRQYNTNDIVPHQVNPATMRAVNLMYEKAYESIADPVYKKRLSMDWIAYLWTDFWLGFSGPGHYDAVKGTWSVPMQDGELRSKYGKLTKQFMADNQINVLKERRPLNPSKLSLDKMGIDWPAANLKSGTVQAVVVPGVGGKITEFRDSRTDFDPLKPYWGLLITEYPMQGSWRDMVNNEVVVSYVPNGPATADTVPLMGNAGSRRVHKTVSVKDGALHVDISAMPRTDIPVKDVVIGPATLNSAFMLDLQDKGFGDYPAIYVEKKDGTWTKRVLGSETTFWYIAGQIDIKDATGRVVFASEKRKEGLLLTFDPAQMSQLGFEYDRYTRWGTADQGRMVWISPTATTKELAAGQRLSLSLQLKILPDAAAVLKEMQQ